jgi:hypothetical protein
VKQTSRNASLAPFFIFLGWVGAHAADAIFWLIVSNSSPTPGSNARYYIFRTLHWIELVALIAFVAVGAITLFKNRR